MVTEAKVARLLGALALVVGVSGLVVTWGWVVPAAGRVGKTTEAGLAAARWRLERLAEHEELLVELPQTAAGASGSAALLLAGTATVVHEVGTLAGAAGAVLDSTPAPVGGLIVPDDALRRAADAAEGVEGAIGPLARDIGVLRAHLWGLRDVLVRTSSLTGAMIEPPPSAHVPSLGAVARSLGTWQRALELAPVGPGVALGGLMSLGSLVFLFIGAGFFLLARMLVLVGPPDRARVPRPPRARPFREMPG